MNEQMFPDPIEQYRMQEALQDRAYEDQQKLVAPQLQEQMDERKAVLIAETDPKKDIKELILEFRGLEERDGKLVRTSEPILNDIGARKLSSLLRPIMSNNTRLARMKEVIVKKFTLGIIDDITLDLGVNWRSYGIKDRSAKDFIIDAIIILVYSILSRAEDQNEKNWLGKVSFENVGGTRYGSPEKKESWLDKFKI